MGGKDGSRTRNGSSEGDTEAVIGTFVVLRGTTVRQPGGGWMVAARHGHGFVARNEGSDLLL
jgi:hypothetical protein